MPADDRPPASPWSLLTRLVHEGERGPAPGAIPTATPIYTSATYLHKSAAELDEVLGGGPGYVYARYGNPTVAALEQVMTVAEGGVGAVAFGSGMAALHGALLAACTQRGEVHPRPRCILAARDLYGATTKLLQDFFLLQGVQVHFCDMNDDAVVDEALSRLRPDAVLIEQISNPLLLVADIESLSQRVHGVGARLLVDSTMTTPILQRPLLHGADLVIHSATKFLGGHSDVTGGVVVARAGLLLDSLRRYCKLLGAILGPFEAYLLLRGVKTLSLRVRRQCENAARIAAWLVEQDEVVRVRYPGLPSHPQHALSSRVFDGLHGAMVTFELRQGGREALYRFLDGVRLILPVPSLGDIYTLASAPLISSHRDLTPEQRAERCITDGMLRLSVGIEEVADLLADLRSALSASTK